MYFAPSHPFRCILHKHSRYSRQYSAYEDCHAIFSIISFLFHIYICIYLPLMAPLAPNLHFHGHQITHSLRAKVVDLWHSVSITVKNWAGWCDVYLNPWLTATNRMITNHSVMTTNMVSRLVSGYNVDIQRDAVITRLIFIKLPTVTIDTL